MRNFDFATWELQWDHRSPPVLTVNFLKRPEGLPPHDPKDDPSTADRTLAFKRFLDNNRIDLYGAGENTEFYPKEGVAKVTGKKNIDKLAAWLHHHNDATGKNDQYLALIPPSVSRNYGKGEENYPATAGPKFQLDGNPSESKPDLTLAQLAAIRRKQEKAAELKLELRGALQGKPVAAHTKIAESFVRRGLKAETVAQVLEGLRGQDELPLASAATTAPAAPIAIAAERPAVLHDGHETPEALQASRQAFTAALRAEAGRRSSAVVADTGAKAGDDAPAQGAFTGEGWTAYVARKGDKTPHRPRKR